MTTFPYTLHRTLIKPGHITKWGTVWSVDSYGQYAWVGTAARQHIVTMTTNVDVLGFDEEVTA